MQHLIRAGRVCALLMAITLGLVSAALAGTIQVGPPGNYNGDWTQEFEQSGLSMPLTLQQYIMQAPTNDLNLVTTIYSDQGETLPVPGWTATLVDPHYGYQQGPGDQNNFYWTLGFISPPSTPLSFYLQAWDGNTFDSADSAIAHWDGNGKWTFSPLNSPVPEPSVLLLFGSGLLGLAGVVRRRLLA